MTLGAALILAVVALGACVLIASARRRRTPHELRGDWWSAFERDFRSYVAAQAKSAGRQRRENKRRSTG